MLGRLMRVIMSERVQILQAGREKRQLMHDERVVRQLASSCRLRVQAKKVYGRYTVGIVITLGWASKADM